MKVCLYKIDSFLIDCEYGLHPVNLKWYTKACDATSCAWGYAPNRRHTFTVMEMNQQTHEHGFV